MPPLPLADWRDFYVMIGATSGTIVGATFIVATLAGGLPPRSTGIRIFIEEAALTKGIAGYDAYMARARYRLVPGLWSGALAIARTRRIERIHFPPPFSTENGGGGSRGHQSERDGGG